MGWTDKWTNKIREMDKNKVFDKLEALRSALIRMFIIIAAFSVVSYFFWRDGLQFLQKPLGQPMVMYTISEGFFTSLRLALFMGLFFSMPFIFYGLWGAFTPFFSFNSRRYSLLIVFSAMVLFYGGFFFCYYFALPSANHFLTTYAQGTLDPMIGLAKYTSFAFGLMIAFGAVFELPLVMLILGRIGIVNYNFLAKNRKYALLLNAVLSALITPTPDAYTMTLMMVPIQFLYELSIWLVRIFGKKKVPEPEPTFEPT